MIYKHTRTKVYNTSFGLICMYSASSISVGPASESVFTGSSIAFLGCVVRYFMSILVLQSS